MNDIKLNDVKTEWNYDYIDNEFKTEISSQDLENYLSLMIKMTLSNSSSN
nr:hypothetical protein [Mycoplasmopsis bovis]QQH18754.1 hypothetical protein HYE49_00935 [Mycoplasmopsis bovis]